MAITKESYERELQELSRISKEHPDELGCYVYALAEPLDNGKGQVFYIGKGKKNRVLDHVLEELGKAELTDDEIVGKKLKRIRKIHKAGKKVRMYILHYGLTDELALIVESVLIDVFSNFKEIDTFAIGELTNGIGGYDCRRGVCSLGDLADSMKAREEIDVAEGEKVLCIKISSLDDSNPDVYERVRKYWVINPNRANKADYVAACLRGVIVGLYENKSGWKRAIGMDDPIEEGRCYFEGVPVKDPSVLSRYVGRTITTVKGAANPVMYVGGWK